MAVAEVHSSMNMEKLLALHQGPLQMVHKLISIMLGALMPSSPMSIANNQLSTNPRPIQTNSKQFEGLCMGYY